MAPSISQPQIGFAIASGLGTPTTVTPETDGSTYVKITLQTDPTNAVVANLTDYLIVRNGENTIYMATYPTAEPAVGELRWITRLNSALIPNCPIPIGSARHDRRNRKHRCFRKR